MLTARRSLPCLIAFVCLSAWLITRDFAFSDISASSQNNNASEGRPYRGDVELVVASLEAEDSSWISSYLPDWYAHIYVVDDPGAPLTVPKNKGREAMVYLTHIINHYSNLPPKVGA